MGAEAFIHGIEGVSADLAFNELVRDADIHYGTQSYNGSINTCSMGRCRKRYDKYSKKVSSEARQLVEDWDNGDKWVADYIDMGISHYEAITFKKVLVQASPKYKLSYAVNQILDYNASKIIKTFDTKTKADNHAIALSIKNLDNAYVVTKEYVLIEGKKEVTKIEKVVKIYKTKPKLKPLPNRIVVPIHKYLFFGWASN